MAFADLRRLTFSGLPAATGFLACLCFASGWLAGAPAQAADRTPLAAATPSPTAPATLASPAPATPSSSNTTESAVNTDSAKIVDVQAMPAAITAGKAKWDDGLSAIIDSETKLKAALVKAGLKSAGPPLTVFTQTDESGFTYEAMLPLAEKPQGKTGFSDDIKIGSSPAGRAMKFHYHGPYDDIDSTYDLITAYLDEKDLEAKDYFVEEYLTEPKSADDPNLAVDIYIFLK